MVSVPRGWNWMWQQKRNSLDFLGKIAAVDGELIVESGQCLNCFYVQGVPRGRGESHWNQDTFSGPPQPDKTRHLCTSGLQPGLCGDVEAYRYHLYLLWPPILNFPKKYPKNNQRHPLDRPTNSPMKAESDRQGLAGILWPLWPVSRPSGHLPFMGLLYSRLTC